MFSAASQPTIWCKGLHTDLDISVYLTMDHDAIICFIIDRLARGPDQDAHVQPAVNVPSKGMSCTCN